jgi:hypothetical protein
MSNFEIIHEEFCEIADEASKVVNGLGLDEYLNDVRGTYKTAVQQQDSDTQDGKLDESAVTKVVGKLEAYSHRIKLMCEDFESCMAQGYVDSALIVSSGKDDLASWIDIVYDLLSQLKTLVGHNDVLYLSHKDDAYVLIDRVDKVQRACTHQLKQLKIDSRRSNFDSIRSDVVVKQDADADSSILPPMTSVSLGDTNSVVRPSTPPTQTQPAQGPPGMSGVSSVTLSASAQTYVPLISSQAPSSSYFPNYTTPTVSHPMLSVPTLPTSTYTNSQNFMYPDFRPPDGLRANRHGDMHLKKISLPEFSGSRKDWPEFRAVWKELAENSYLSKSALAFELKRSLKGTALEKVKHIYVTKPDAYDLIWARLSEYYDDTTACVQAALECLNKLKPVAEQDYRALVNLVNVVEDTCAQLEQLGQIHLLSMRDVDKVADFLPVSIRAVWNRKYHEMTVAEKLSPFLPFVNFLNQERAIVARLADTQKKSSTSSHKTGSHAASQGAFQGTSQGTYQGKKIVCVVHPSGTHKTVDCRDFKKLSLDDKYAALREAHLCFKCFGNHRRDKCKDLSKCEHCHKANHPSLLCRSVNNETEESAAKNASTAVTSSHASQNGSSQSSPTNLSLYAIQQVVIASSGKEATVFCDSGSNSTYITHKAAQKLNAEKLESYSLDVTTMGNQEKTYNTCLYEISFKTASGQTVPVQAFGMKEITGPVSLIEEKCIRKIFPHYSNPKALVRHSTTVDVLLGCDYFGLHPKHEVSSVGHLSIMRGELGDCLQGTHSDLQESTKFSLNMVRAIHDKQLHVDCNFTRMQVHPEFNAPVTYACALPDSNVNSTCMLSYCKVSNETESFISGEELGTETNPKCGGCKCGKCPTVCHTYSFQEEQELNMIRSNLQYDEDNCCWRTKYPWIVDPSELPDNYLTALATLRSTERTLGKDKLWSQLYADQIQDMIDRGVARKLSEEEIAAWTGPTFYISHLAVCNPNSKSTPVRIVFNSSQKCKGTSLNAALAKGPDGYMNNLLGLLLRWREEQTAVVGDIRKMFHSVFLDEVAQHCHRFLWRNMDETRKPDVYIMLRVNMGDKPAPAISTEAIYLTVEKFGTDCPQAAKMLKCNTYVDDIVDSFPSKETARSVVHEAEELLQKGGFRVKCWQFSGESDVTPGMDSHAVPLLKGNDQVTRVLGVGTVKMMLLFSRLL